MKTLYVLFIAMGLAAGSSSLAATASAWNGEKYVEATGTTQFDAAQTALFECEHSFQIGNQIGSQNESKDTCERTLIIYNACDCNCRNDVMMSRKVPAVPEEYNLLETYSPKHTNN